VPWLAPFVPGSVRCDRIAASMFVRPWGCCPAHRHDLLCCIVFCVRWCKFIDVGALLSFRCLRIGQSLYRFSATCGGCQERRSSDSAKISWIPRSRGPHDDRPQGVCWPSMNCLRCIVKQRKATRFRGEGHARRDCLAAFCRDRLGMKGTIAKKHRQYVYNAHKEYCKAQSLSRATTTAHGAGNSRRRVVGGQGRPFKCPELRRSYITVCRSFAFELN
jgi:hypothetical protein